MMKKKPKTTDIRGIGGDDHNFRNIDIEEGQILTVHAKIDHSNSVIHASVSKFGDRVAIKITRTDLVDGVKERDSSITHLFDN